MKKVRIISLTLIVLQSIFYFGCDDAFLKEENDNSILPERFGVEIPEALSNQSAATTNGRTADVDSLDGNIIYSNLSLFIWVGESSSLIVKQIIATITIYGIDQPLTMTYESDDDGRTKHLVVVEQPVFEGKEWEYGLTISDVASEGNADGGKAIQIFWNRRPIEGVAILKPYNIDRKKDGDAGESIVRIDYSETGDMGYDAHMIVSIADFPLEDPLVNPYSPQTLKMFVGRQGDYVDVYGNTNHPNAKFFTSDTGFNWAFVAAGKHNSDIGVAEVGLPPSELDSDVRDVILKDHSIKEVFTQEINEVWPFINPNSLATFLGNTEAPGYFDQYGFVQGGTSPGSEFDPLAERIKSLTPYNPAEVTALSINFQ